MQHFMHKINYLFISLEALNLNYFKNSNTYYNEYNNTLYKTKLKNNIINIKNKKDINIYQISYSYQCQYIFKLIILLYHIINKDKISEITQLIFTQEKLLNQYIKKFYNIYFNNNDYYTLYTANEIMNIKNIAITNLYIIYISTKKNNILYLTYHLIN